MSSRKDVPVNLEAEAEAILPSTDQMDATPITNPGGVDIELAAVRRQKVRELHNLGYGSDDIRKILAKGVKINDTLYHVPCTVKIIQEDLDWIINEEMAADRQLPEKKRDMLIKYQFLYNRAMVEYANAKGAIKNSFLNTAKSILDKIAELEGINFGDKNVKLASETRPSQVAEEVGGALNEDEQFAIDTAIEKVLADRKRKGTGRLPVVQEEPDVRASSSDDEGVPVESPVHDSARQTKTS